MPPVNQVASAGIIVASVAVAAAIALYESPELRRVADDLRRRIAVALHSLGDNVDPAAQQRDPIFNRPEDAEGFLLSRSGGGNEDGVDADDETRRRQREELMYWNSVREEKKQQQLKQEDEQSGSGLGHRRISSRGTTFDDFLQEDRTAERGTLVYNTGASPWDDEQRTMVRRRGVEGVRGLNASMIANPFADEYGIELDDHPGMQNEPHSLSPGRDEVMSDIYDATPQDGRSIATASHTLSPQSKPEDPEVLFDFESHTRSTRSESATVDHEAAPQNLTRSHLLDRELADDEYMTAGQDDRNHEDVYASIQAWAQNSNTSFYSPLPESPVAPLSEPELISEGGLTPTDTMSLAGSGVDVGNDAASSRAGDYDVLSEDGDGIPTPSSWSEVGSVISESDSALRA